MRLSSTYSHCICTQAALSVRGLAPLSWSSNAPTFADHLACAPEQLADVEFELHGEPEADGASASAQPAQPDGRSVADTGTAEAAASYRPVSATAAVNASAPSTGANAAEGGVMEAGEIVPDDEDMAPIHHFLHDFMLADLAMARPSHTQLPHNAWALFDMNDWYILFIVLLLILILICCKCTYFIQTYLRTLNQTNLSFVFPCACTMNLSNQHVVLLFSKYLHI